MCTSAIYVYFVTNSYLQYQPAGWVLFFETLLQSYKSLQQNIHFDYYMYRYYERLQREYNDEELLILTGEWNLFQQRSLKWLNCQMTLPNFSWVGSHLSLKQHSNILHWRDFRQLHSRIIDHWFMNLSCCWCWSLLLSHHSWSCHWVVIDPRIYVLSQPLTFCDPGQMQISNWRRADYAVRRKILPSLSVMLATHHPTTLHGSHQWL